MYSAARLDPAPGLLSTMTPWPSARVSGSLIVRAMMSAAPPGAKPTTRRIGLVGYVRGELGGGTVHDHAAVLEDVAVIGVAQRDVRVLLREQKTHLLLLIEVLHDLEDLLDDLRREPHRRLVEQDHARMGHQRAPKGGHLLLAP